jgi:hypothetical protein
VVFSPPLFLSCWFVNLRLFCCFFVFFVILCYLASRGIILCDLNSRAEREGWMYVESGKIFLW